MCSTSAVGHQQSDLIGRLLIVIVNKFAYKSIPNTFWAVLKNKTFKQKVLWLLFGQLFESFRVLYIPTSGHTGLASQRCGNIMRDFVIKIFNLREVFWVI